MEPLTLLGKIDAQLKKKKPKIKVVYVHVKTFQFQKPKMDPSDKNGMLVFTKSSVIIYCIIETETFSKI